MRRGTRIALVTAGSVLLAQAAVLFVVARFGLYDVSATEQHPQLVYSGLDWALEKAVERHSATVEPPDDLSDPVLIARGFVEYQAQCVRCHGAPGVAPEPFALAMIPLPPPLVQAAREDPPAEIFWAIKHGIKMTGMPAWEFRMSDREIWAVTAFVEILPMVAPLRYREMVRELERDDDLAEMAHRSRP